jgi:hypothetical protein
MIPPKLAILIPVFMLPVSALADWKTDVGYVDLQTALGAGIPTGAGVSVSQIEANEGTSPTFKYLADFTPTPAMHSVSVRFSMAIPPASPRA